VDIVRLGLKSPMVSRAEPDEESGTKLTEAVTAADKRTPSQPSSPSKLWVFQIARLTVAAVGGAHPCPPVTTPL